MTELIAIQKTMSSREIAELTGKEHKNVLRDIRALLEQGVDRLNFELVEYKDAKGETRPCYELTKKGCLILASGYDALLREKIINRWEELEIAARNNAPALPQNYLEALKALVASEEEKERLMLENKANQEIIERNEEQITELSTAIATMQPKISYLDTILSSKETVTTTQIAQDYGMSAKAFNKQLRDMRLQGKVNGQWILLMPYLAQGYVQSKTFSIEKPSGGTKTVSNTEWTQKGRLFLYEQLKREDIYPLIEQAS